MKRKSRRFPRDAEIVSSDARIRENGTDERQRL
jgi:hypothetical protein